MALKVAADLDFLLAQGRLSDTEVGMRDGLSLKASSQRLRRQGRGEHFNP